MADGAKGNGGNGMRIDPKLVRELAELLSENHLTEIEVEDGDRKIRVKRETPTMIAATSPTYLAPAAGSAPPAPTAAAPQLSAPPMAGKEDLGVPAEAPGAAVKSPMVGTAFLSPQPGAAPFVNVGDAVKAGDTLLIIEAMKVMNPITAPEGGIIKQVLVADAQPVEFDQPLVVIG